MSTTPTPTPAKAPVADLPDEVLHFTLASRYCESDRLSNTAWALFGGVPEGWTRVQAVIDWVHDNVTFATGSSDTGTGATEIYVNRRGVCRDFTQLAVAFLRGLNVPARYCFGYLPDIDVPIVPEPMDFAAWLEAYVGDRWYTFDPRNNQRRTGRVVIGRGRDALDVAMLTSYGRAPLDAMRVVAEPVSAAPWSSAYPPVLRRVRGGLVRLPLGDEFDGVDEPGRPAGVDTSAVDWTRVRRSAYVIQQSITYQYDGPVHRLRQRLVVQPREHHGDQRRVSRRVEVVDATPRTRAGRARRLRQPRRRHRGPVRRRAGHLPLLERGRAPRGPRSTSPSGALLHDRRLLDTTPLTAADGDLDALISDLRDTRLQGGELALAACQRVYELMRYAHDVTTVRTTAAEAFAKRTGVCQDFAHVLLAVTRGLGLPSRYVSGQLLGSGGSHAWVEVLVPDGSGHARVMALDPTHGCSVGMTYLTIAVGRDYADIAPVSGTYVAPHAGTLTMRKRVSLMRVDHDGRTSSPAEPRSLDRAALSRGGRARPLRTARW